jgi:hypothetical protein
MPILEEYRRCPCILGSDGLLFKNKYIQTATVVSFHLSKIHFPKTQEKKRREESFVHIHS